MECNTANNLYPIPACSNPCHSYNPSCHYGTEKADVTSVDSGALLYYPDDSEWGPLPCPDGVSDTCTNKCVGSIVVDTANIHEEEKSVDTPHSHGESKNSWKSVLATAKVWVM